MQTFLINLDRSPDRLAFMQEQADRMGIAFERIPGVDGAANVPQWMQPQFEDTPLTSGEIGCYASHLVCARRIVEDCLDYALVLEDDVTLQEDFTTIARRSIAKAPTGWDYIHLSSHIKRAVVHVADLSGSRILIRHTRLPVNTAAYILSNAGARKWLKPRPRVRPNDMDVRYGWIYDLDIYGVYPSPASQENNFISDIGGTNNPFHKEAKHNWSPGMMSRFHGEYWQVKKIGVGNTVRARLANIANSLRRKIGGERRVSILK